MESLRRFYRALEDYLPGTLLFTGLTLIMINVILRYFFNRPRSVLDEFSVYFIVWGAVLGFAVALRDNHHIKVDMVYNFLPVNVKWVVSIFAHLVGLTFALLFTWFGTELVYNYIISGQRSTDSRFPLWIVYLVMPLSGLMFSGRYFDKLYDLLREGGRPWRERERRGGRAEHGDGIAL